MTFQCPHCHRFLPTPKQRRPLYQVLWCLLGVAVGLSGTIGVALWFQSADLVGKTVFQEKIIEREPVILVVRVEKEFPPFKSADEANAAYKRLYQQEALRRKK